MTTTDSRYHHYLLFDDSTHWNAALAKKSMDDGSTTYPIELPVEAHGPFVQNLMDREHAFTREVFGSQKWRGWSVSEKEWMRLARLAALAENVKEFNRLVAA